MKKSQLRTIIRESIKELITEQAVVTSHNTIELQICNSQDPNHTIGQIVNTSMQNPNMGWTCNGAACDPATDLNKFYELTSNSGYTMQFELIGLSHPVTVSNSSFPQANMISSTCPNSFHRPGCGVPQALNYMKCCPPGPLPYNVPAALNCVPNVLVDNCCEFEDPDWGWNCEQIGDHWKFGHHCVPGNVYNPGQYATQQDCMSASPCADYLPWSPQTGDMENPGFESPLTTTPQSMVKPDDEITRMKKLAKIR